MKLEANTFVVGNELTKHSIIFNGWGTWILGFSYGNDHLWRTLEIAVGPFVYALCIKEEGK